MFGFEFSNLTGPRTFPQYERSAAIPADSILRVVPLVWQEHCVECGMPACYETCVRYQKRCDGRCLLFHHGIQRINNPSAILGQNAIIEMRPWAKLETFFFPTVLPYKRVKSVNRLYVAIARTAQIAKHGKIRRLCYYAKEFISRKIGYADKSAILPKYLLFEAFNENDTYSLALENHCDDQVVFRTTLSVKSGYNRFLIPTESLRFGKGKKNTLCMYSSEEKELVLNIISLEMVDFKPEYEKDIIPANTKKVKLVVWDLDNTLWKGILTEDGPEGIELNQQVVSIIKELDAKGIVNSIASKNDFERVLPVLKQLGLEEHFVAPMVNWNPKSQNIKALAKNINLGIDSFVFVDDTPNELQEVAANCTGIRVCNVKDIAGFVKTDVFDVPVTEESKKRRQMYQELSLRNQDALRYEDNIDDFLRDCRMVMHINHPQDAESERCFELLQRTNQLNISAQRLSREELAELLQDSQYDCFRIKVDDKYGDYGLVGFAVFHKADPETVILRHFVFSCRAARKKLEQTFFEYAIRLYKESGYKHLRLICKKTEKNALMQSVLAESGLFQKENETAEGFELTADLNDESQITDIAKIQTD